MKYLLIAILILTIACEDNTPFEGDTEVDSEVVGSDLGDLSAWELLERACNMEGMREHPESEIDMVYRSLITGDWQECGDNDLVETFYLESDEPICPTYGDTHGDTASILNEYKERCF